jgi:iron(III) transport system permease protein
LLNTGLIDEPINWLGGGNRLGIVALQVIHLVPLLYLTISASLKNAHVTLEEAALMSGASRWRVLRTITIPLSLPGWFAGATLVFIASFTDLGTPLVFEYRNVVSVQIYNMLSDLNENPVGYSFVVFTCLLSVVLFNLSKASVMTGGFAGTGRGREGGASRYLSTPIAFLACAATLGYAVVACVPQMMVVALACSRDWFMSVLPQTWTAHHLIEVLYHPLTARSLVISTVLSLVASGLTVIVGLLTAFRIRRGRGLQRQVFEAVSLIPLAVPGIVFAFGFVGAFTGTIIDNRVNPFPLLIAAYTIRRMPAMVRSAFAGLQEANIALEEASYMVGASAFKTTRRVILPLVSRHLIVGAMLTFAYSMIEVSDSLLLALEAKFYPVSKAIYALMGRPDGLEVASALGVVVMFIMILTFYLAEAFSRRSLQARRLSCILLFLGVLGVSPTASADDDEVVIVTPHWEGIRQEFSTAFSEQWKRETGRDVTRNRS